uniref:Uncharacterized protein n=1 Tax=Anopheles farauti TaxID=69004 RepID=A0A182QAZ5_9DIPT
MVAPLVLISSSADALSSTSTRAVLRIAFFTSSGDRCGTNSTGGSSCSSTARVIRFANRFTFSFTLSRHSSSGVTTAGPGSLPDTNGPDVRIFFTSSAVEINFVTLSDTLSRHSSDLRCSSRSSYSGRWVKRAGWAETPGSCRRRASSTNLLTFSVTLNSDSSSSVTRSRLVMRVAWCVVASSSCCSSRCCSSTSVISHPTYSFVASSKIGILLMRPGVARRSSSGSWTVSGYRGFPVSSVSGDTGIGTSLFGVGSRDDFASCMSITTLSSVSVVVAFSAPTPPATGFVERLIVLVATCFTGRSTFFVTADTDFVVVVEAVPVTLISITLSIGSSTSLLSETPVSLLDSGSVSGSTTGRLADGGFGTAGLRIDSILIFATVMWFCFAAGAILSTGRRLSGLVAGVLALPCVAISAARRFTSKSDELLLVMIRLLVAAVVRRSNFVSDDCFVSSLVDLLRTLSVTSITGRIVISATDMLRPSCFCSTRIVALLLVVVVVVAAVGSFCGELDLAGCFTGDVSREAGVDFRTGDVSFTGEEAFFGGGETSLRTGDTSFTGEDAFGTSLIGEDAFGTSLTGEDAFGTSLTGEDAFGTSFTGEETLRTGEPSLDGDFRGPFSFAKSTSTRSVSLARRTALLSIDLISCSIFLRCSRNSERVCCTVVTVLSYVLKMLPVGCFWSTRASSSTGRFGMPSIFRQRSSYVSLRTSGGFRPPFAPSTCGESWVVLDVLSRRSCSVDFVVAVVVVSGFPSGLTLERPVGSVALERIDRTLPVGETERNERAKESCAASTSTVMRCVVEVAVEVEEALWAFSSRTKSPVVFLVDVDVAKCCSCFSYVRVVTVVPSSSRFVSVIIFVDAFTIVSSRSITFPAPCANRKASRTRSGSFDSSLGVVRSFAVCCSVDDALLRTVALEDVLVTERFSFAPKSTASPFCCWRTTWDELEHEVVVERVVPATRRPSSPSTMLSSTSTVVDRSPLLCTKPLSSPS